MIILGADYNKCLSNTEGFSEFSTGQGLCANAILPVLTIAARGFTLWVVNIALALVFIKIRNNIKNVNIMYLQIEITN